MAGKTAINGSRVVAVADPAEIARALPLLFVPGQVVELRILRDGKFKRVDSGYFDDFGLLGRAIYAAAKPSAEPAAGIYYTLNPVNPALLARAHNRVQAGAKFTTTDVDILERAWLLGDIDPTRPAGISATNEEHEAALELGREMIFDLTEAGWPRSLLCDSGNGGYSLSRIKLPNDDRSRLIVEKGLAALARRYNNEKAGLDVKVFNAARIIRAMGTVNRKGDDTLERPHRVARILIPEKR
jgi:hypothetical protein